MDWKFITDLLWGVFFSYYSIFTWIGLVSSIFLFFPRLEGTMKDRLANARPYALSILLAFILISTILTSYSMHGNIHNTKQDIRSFFESINPEILHRVDTSRDEIPVLLGSQDQLKLSELSKRSDFDSYLSARKGKDGVIVDGRPTTNELRRMGQTGYMDRYYFYPKDALAK